MREEGSDVERKADCIIASASVSSYDDMHDIKGKRTVGYVIRLCTTEMDCWETTKRYSDFLGVHKILIANKASLKEIVEFDFPKKEFGWFSFNKEVIEFRRGRFDTYVKLLRTLNPLPDDVKRLFDILSTPDSHELTRQDSNLSVEPSAHTRKKASTPREYSPVSTHLDRVGEENEEADNEEEDDEAYHVSEPEPEPTRGDLRNGVNGVILTSGEGKSRLEIAPVSLPFQSYHTTARPSLILDNNKTMCSIFMGFNFLPAFLLVAVFVVLVLVGINLESDEPKLMFSYVVLGLTCVFTLIQPGIIPSGFFCLWLAMDAILVFSIVYFALLIGYLTSAIQVLAVACVFTFGLATIEGLLFPGFGFNLQR